MDSQNDEGPAPLLWRISDFLNWAKLCPFEQEIGHALTHLVMTGQEIPNACEVWCIHLYIHCNLNGISQLCDTPMIISLTVGEGFHIINGV